jgi:hypothetical protein
MAVMRKLLLLSYSLWKNDPPYHPATTLPQKAAPTPEGAEAAQDELEGPP